MKWRLFYSAVLLIASGCAFSQSAPLPSQSGLPQATVDLGGQSIQVELANTFDSRRIGLMGRPNLPDNGGMLFDFGEDSTQCMWMKNTLIDLDVAFIDKQGRILNIEAMRAGTTDIHCSVKPARYALEMNLNWFANRAIKPGRTLKITSKP